MIVVVTLLVAGHTCAILTRSVIEPVKMAASHGLSNLEPLITSGIVGCTLGALGVLSALVVARCNRNERPWIKL
jgi:hypothetical protein